MRLIRAAVFSAVCVTLSAAGHEMASSEGIPAWALLAGWLGMLAVAMPLAGRERSLPGIAALLLTGQLVLHTLFSLGQRSVQAMPAGTAPGGSARIMALATRLLCNPELLHLSPADAERIVRQAGIAQAGAAGFGMSPSPAGSPGTLAMSGMFGGGGSMPGMPGMSGGMSMSLSMLAGHLIAALIAGWLLRRGEAELWRLVRLSVQRAAQVAALLPVSAVVAFLQALPRIAALVAERVVAARRPHRCGRTRRRLESVALLHSVIRRGPPALVLAA